MEALRDKQSADELALELDDVAEAILSVPGLLSKEQRTLLRDLDRQLHELSDPRRIPRLRRWGES